jgi:hypothetical protein
VKPSPGHPAPDTDVKLNLRKIVPWIVLAVLFAFVLVHRQSRWNNAPLNSLGRQHHDENLSETETSLSRHSFHLQTLASTISSFDHLQKLDSNHGQDLESQSKEDGDLEERQAPRPYGGRTARDWGKDGKQLLCLMRRTYELGDTFIDNKGETTPVTSKEYSVDHLQEHGWVRITSSESKGVNDNEGIGMYKGLLEKLGLRTDWGDDATTMWINNDQEDVSRMFKTNAIAHGHKRPSRKSSEKADVLVVIGAAQGHQGHARLLR